MFRGIWGDPKRFKETYWGTYDETYFAGDGAHRDKNGYFWIMGRVDDVMNVSGHRIGTMEVESALVSNPDVAEAAVVGRPDDITGTAIVAWFSPVGGTDANDALVGRLKQHVSKEIGAIARPAEIRFTTALPKTRSGKIMRRLRDIASGKEVAGDESTLEDFSVLSLRERRPNRMGGKTMTLSKTQQANADVYLESFSMHGLQRRNPGEPEFHQAVHEVARDIVPFLEDKQAYKDAHILDRMTEPDRVIVFRVCWTDDAEQRPRESRDARSVQQRHRPV